MNLIKFSFKNSLYSSCFILFSFLFVSAASHDTCCSSNWLKLVVSCSQLQQYGIKIKEMMDVIMYINIYRDIKGKSKETITPYVWGKVDQRTTTFSMVTA
ncbi:hypothetical protein V6Z12_A10G006200 [Gossypium hirsutum]